MSYATLSEARDEGITTEQANDTRLQQLLDDASERIDSVTGWWFSPRALTLTLDGNGTDTLPLPAPVIALTSVTMSDAAIDLAQVIVRGNVTSPQRSEILYPRLQRREATVWEPPFSPERPRWLFGVQNIVVVGTFGFTKANGTSPPSDIRKACLRLALRELPRLTDTTGQAERQRGRLFRETTDGHSYELGGVLPGAVGAWRGGGLTGDPDIDTILAQYRRPPKGAIVGVPRTSTRAPWGGSGGGWPV